MYPPATTIFIDTNCISATKTDNGLDDGRYIRLILGYPMISIDTSNSTGPNDTIDPKDSTGPNDTIDPKDSTGPNDTIDPKHSIDPNDTIDTIVTRSHDSTARCKWCSAGSEPAMVR